LSVLQQRLEETSTAKSAVESEQFEIAEGDRSGAHLEEERCWRAAGGAGLRLRRTRHLCVFFILGVFFCKAPGISPGDAFSKTVDTVVKRRADIAGQPCMSIVIVVIYIYLTCIA
jgi:hypothetical protein